MHENKAQECTVKGILVDFGLGDFEKQVGGFEYKHQLLSDECTIFTGIKYVLQINAYPHCEYIKITSDKCFDTKQELLNSL